MKLAVCLVLLVAIIAPGYSQRRCFQCTDCEQPFNRDSSLVSVCMPVTTTTVSTETDTDTDTDTDTFTISNEPTFATPKLTPVPPQSEIIPTNEPPTTAPTPPAIHTTTASIRLPSGGNPMDSPPSDDVPANNFRCYRVKRDIDGRRQVNRGCVEWSDTREATCAQIDGATNYNCDICDDNECNASTRLITQFSIILAALLLTLKFY